MRGSRQFPILREFPEVTSVEKVVAEMKARCATTILPPWGKQLQDEERLESGEKKQKERGPGDFVELLNQTKPNPTYMSPYISFIVEASLN